MDEYFLWRMHMEQMKMLTPFIMLVVMGVVMGGAWIYDKLSNIRGPFER